MMGKEYIVPEAVLYYAEIYRDDTSLTSHFDRVRSEEFKKEFQKAEKFLEWYLPEDESEKLERELAFVEVLTKGILSVTVEGKGRYRIVDHRLGERGHILVYKSSWYWVDLTEIKNIGPYTSIYHSYNFLASSGFRDLVRDGNLSVSRINGSER